MNFNKFSLAIALICASGALTSAWAQNSANTTKKSQAPISAKALSDDLNPFTGTPVGLETLNAQKTAVQLRSEIAQVDAQGKRASFDGLVWEKKLALLKRGGFDSVTPSGDLVAQPSRNVADATTVPASATITPRGKGKTTPATAARVPTREATASPLPLPIQAASPPQQVTFTVGSLKLNDAEFALREVNGRVLVESILDPRVSHALAESLVNNGATVSQISVSLPATEVASKQAALSSQASQATPTAPNPGSVSAPPPALKN